MALVDCPECGHQVSDAAETCPSCGVRLTDQPADTQLQLELTQIDLEWERARAKLMVGTLYGPVVPSKLSAVIGGLLPVVLGIGLGIAIVAMEPPEVASMAATATATICILVGLGAGAWGYSKAQAYQEAEAEYRRKREAVRSKYETQAHRPT